LLAGGRLRGKDPQRFVDWRDGVARSGVDDGDVEMVHSQNRSGVVRCAVSSMSLLSQSR